LFFWSLIFPPDPADFQITLSNRAIASFLPPSPRSSAPQAKTGKRAISLLKENRPFLKLAMQNFGLYFALA
jgi:hypothetical protein